MSDLLLKQLELTRGFLLKKIDKTTDEVARIQPEGFNNNILWNIGHVLTVTEQFLFGYPNKSTNLPENYINLFTRGTKPADWKEDGPTVEELKKQLKDQLQRMKEIPPELFERKLKEPFLEFETFGELANFAAFHEAHHHGQIQTLQRFIR